MSEQFVTALRRAGIVRPWQQFPHDAQVHHGRPLIWSLDNFQWDSRTVAQVAADIRSHRPLYVRMANFYPRIIELLAQLSDIRLNVLWKQEFWGYDTAGRVVPAAPGVDPARYAADVASTGHNIVPYTFNAWNHEQISKLIPAQRPVHILPVAAKPLRGQMHDLRPSTRAAFGIPAGAAVFGVGGLLDAEKGLEDLVQAFLATATDRHEHMLCAVVVEWEDDHDTITARWRNQFGDQGWERLHLRVGGYGDWQWMSQFYAACDYVLVNSRRDSAPRIVSEPVSLGVPVLAAASACGTNHLVPDLVIVDRFGDFTDPAFRRALSRSRQAAPTLARHHLAEHTLETVRARHVALMAAEADPGDVDSVRAASGDAASLAILNELAVF